jgi:hypothetical protein
MNQKTLAAAMRGEKETMKKFLAGLRRWYLRRFRGYVEAPVNVYGGGTAWQQHFNRWEAHQAAPPPYGIRCRCGEYLSLTIHDLHVRKRNHKDDCQAFHGDAAGMIDCDCRITDARYTKICAHCGLGHWVDASPKHFGRKI